MSVYFVNSPFFHFLHPLLCSNRYPCPPYKIIILDEADSMTEDAQVHDFISFLYLGFPLISIKPRI